MPRGSVMVRIEAKSKEKEEDGEDEEPLARGNLKKMKLSTHFMGFNFMEFEHI